MAKGKEKLIKSKERVSKFAEVYTPQWLVEKMCDLCQEENEDAFTVLTKTWLEPACGNGNFLVEILRRKLLICETPFDGIVAIGSIYGVDILPDNVQEAKERLRAMYADKFGSVPQEIDSILDRNIVCGNFLTKKTVDGEFIWFLKDNCEEDKCNTDISGSVVKTKTRIDSK